MIIDNCINRKRMESANVCIFINVAESRRQDLVTFFKLIGAINNISGLCSCPDSADN